jgi:hypothetical protein
MEDGGWKIEDGMFTVNRDPCTATDFLLLLSSEIFSGFLTYLLNFH